MQTTCAIQLFKKKDKKIPLSAMVMFSNKRARRSFSKQSLSLEQVPAGIAPPAPSTDAALSLIAAEAAAAVAAMVAVDVAAVAAVVASEPAPAEAAACEPDPVIKVAAAFTTSAKKFENISSMLKGSG